MSKGYPQLGDSYNMLLQAMIGVSPSDIIEQSEKHGQQELIRSEVLPRKINYGSREQFEAMGIIYGENADDLFVYVTLPEGWSKQETDHSMWSNLVDDRGRERASIFYKAAFYDMDAFISITRRFSLTVRPVKGWEDRHGEWGCFITDCKQEICQVGTLEPEPEYHGTSGSERQVWLNWTEGKDALAQFGKDYLNENMPDWENPLAYWD
jgi:hypothetical protein